MTNESQISLEDERRRFFRIEDLVHLTYRIIDNNELSERVSLLEKGMVEQFMVMSSLSAITAEMAATFRKIELSDPDVAEYLKAMDRKIDIVGKAIMLDEVKSTENHAVAANLSASGISFHTNETPELGSNVEIKMMLQPSGAGILTYGVVVGNDSIQNDPDYSNQVRIDFTHLREEDRDLLIKHVIRKQGDMLRERRAAREKTSD